MYSTSSQLWFDKCLQVEIFTGRPHQIRIHMAAVGHPLVRDPLFGLGGLPVGIFTLVQVGLLCCISLTVCLPAITAHRFCYKNDQ